MALVSAFFFQCQPPPCSHLFSSEVVRVVERTVVGWFGEGKADMHSYCDTHQGVVFGWDWLAPRPHKNLKWVFGFDDVCCEAELLCCWVGVYFSFHR